MMFGEFATYTQWVEHRLHGRCSDLAKHGLAQINVAKFSRLIGVIEKRDSTAAEASRKALSASKAYESGDPMLKGRILRALKNAIKIEECVKTLVSDWNGAKEKNSKTIGALRGPIEALVEIGEKAYRDLAPEAQALAAEETVREKFNELLQEVEWIEEEEEEEEEEGVEEEEPAGEAAPAVPAEAVPPPPALPAEEAEAVPPPSD
jgi:hypothetical protein